MEARYVAGIATGPPGSSRFQLRTNSVSAEVRSSARFPAAAIVFSFRRCPIAPAFELRLD
jgi:hypothetical protein